MNEGEKGDINFNLKVNVLFLKAKVYLKDGMRFQSLVIVTLQYLYLSSTHPPTSFNPKPPSSLIPHTISILEDDSEGVSSQQLVVVHNPEWLHFRVHVPTLLHTDGRTKEGEGE